MKFKGVNEVNEVGRLVDMFWFQYFLGRWYKANGALNVAAKRPFTSTKKSSYWNPGWLKTGLPYWITISTLWIPDDFRNSYSYLASVKIETNSSHDINSYSHLDTSTMAQMTEVAQVRPGQIGQILAIPEKTKMLVSRDVFFRWSK